MGDEPNMVQGSDRDDHPPPPAEHGPTANVQRSFAGKFFNRDNQLPRPTATSPKRRVLQFSLASALLLFVIASVIGWAVRPPVINVDMVVQGVRKHRDEHGNRMLLACVSLKNESTTENVSYLGGPEVWLYQQIGDEWDYWIRNYGPPDCWNVLGPRESHSLEIVVFEHATMIRVGYCVSGRRFPRSRHWVWFDYEVSWDKPALRRIGSGKQRGGSYMPGPF